MEKRNTGVGNCGYAMPARKWLVQSQVDNGKVKQLDLIG